MTTLVVTRRPVPLRRGASGTASPLRVITRLLLCATVITGALGGCANPEIVQATDCRGAALPCGIVVVDHTRAMSSATVPVSALPGAP